MTTNAEQGAALDEVLSGFDRAIANQASLISQQQAQITGLRDQFGVLKARVDDLEAKPATPTTPTVPTVPTTEKPTFGTSLWQRGGESSATTFKRANDLFGPIKSVRVFDGGNGWSKVASTCAGLPTDVDLIVSSKVATGYEKVLNDLVKSRTGGAVVYACWMHEADAKINKGELTKDAYLATSKAFLTGVKKSCPGVLTTQILMTYSFGDAQLTKNHYDQLFLPSLCDVYGADSYNGDKSGYSASPQKHLTNFVKVARDAGKRWLIGEWGAGLQNPGDEKARADWLETTGRWYSKQADCDSFAYFNSDVGGSFNVENDPLAQEALKKVAAL